MKCTRCGAEKTYSSECRVCFHSVKLTVMEWSYLWAIAAVTLLIILLC